MGFKCGIVGLPNVGKSTLFNALTQTAAAQAANYPFCTIEPNVGQVAVPDPRLDRLAEIEVLTPDADGYDPDDVAIIDAMSRFRAGGYDERLGFTVFETLRYKEALEPLVQQEVRVLLDRLAGEVEPDRASEIIAAGAAPLRELIGAMHSKLLFAELRRQHARG